MLVPHGQFVVSTPNRIYSEESRTGEAEPVSCPRVRLSRVRVGAWQALSPCAAVSRESLGRDHVYSSGGRGCSDSSRGSAAFHPTKPTSFSAFARSSHSTGRRRSSFCLREGTSFESARSTSACCARKSRRGRLLWMKRLLNLRGSTEFMRNRRTKRGLRLTGWRRRTKSELSGRKTYRPRSRGFRRTARR